MALSTLPSPEHREQLVCVCLIFMGPITCSLLRRITVVFENPCKAFFARTHELLQYPFRILALPFEYGKGWSLAGPPNRFHADKPGVRQNELFQLKFQTPDRKTFHQTVGYI